MSSLVSPCVSCLFNFSMVSRSSEVVVGLNVGHSGVNRILRWSSGYWVFLASTIPCASSLGSCFSNLSFLVLIMVWLSGRFNVAYPSVNLRGFVRSLVLILGISITTVVVDNTEKTAYKH